MGEQLGNIEFGFVLPLVPDAVRRDVNGARYPLLTPFFVHLLQMDGGFNHAKSHGGEEKGDEKGRLTGSSEHKAR